MGSCNLPGKYNKRAAAKTADELIVLAIILGFLILVAACMGFAGSLVLMLLVAVFLGIINALFNCRVLSMLHVAIIGYLLFAIMAGVSIVAAVTVSGAAYIAIHTVSLLLKHVRYDRYALR